MEPEKFGAFIAQRRRDLGLKQADLAEMIHVTSKAVSRWERGVGFPDIKLLEPLADALEVTLVELMHSQLLSVEEMEDRVEVTQEIIEQQTKLSWQRNVVLWVGRILIIGSAFFLLRLARNTPWEEPWLGQVVRIIAIAGSFWAHRALEYIVKQLYLQQRPFGVLHSIHWWIVFGLAMLGVLFVRLAADYINGVLLIVGILLFGASIFYYAYHEFEIEQK